VRQQRVRVLLGDLGARVVALVDAVPEAHQLDAVDLVLDAVHVVGGVATLGLDPLEHLQDRLVGAAVQRAVQGVDAADDGRVQRGLGRADHAHRGGGAVLLVVGVEHQEHVEGLGDLVGDLVVRAEHHMEEVAHVSERRIRVDGLLATADALDGGGERRAAAEQTGGGQVDGLGIIDVQVVAVRTEQAHAGGEDRHGVGVAGERLQQGHHLAGQRGLAEDLLGELRELRFAGVLTVESSP